MRHRSQPDFSRSISTGIMGNLVFIGAGVSTIFSVLYLIKHGYNPKDIRIIEEGPSITDPKRKNNILKGFGGAGSYSDFKCIFSTHKDLSVVENYGTDKVLEDHQFIKDMIIEFHPNPDTIGKSEPSAILDEMMESSKGWSNLSILQSESWHIGTNNALQVLTNIENYIKEQGVELLFDTKLVKILNKYGKYVTVPTKEFNTYHSEKTQSIISEEKERKKLIRREIKVLKKEGKYFEVEDLNKKIDMINYRLKVLQPTETEKYYSKLILALGKTGKKFLDEVLEKLNIKTNNNIAQIGVRFETEFNDSIKEIAKEQYDFKFMKHYDNMKIRTFCVNHSSAYVAIEDVDDFAPRKQANGHAYGLDSDKENGLSNWGIIAEVDLSNIVGIDSNSYINDILQKMNYDLKYVKGRGFNFKSSNDSGDEISVDEFVEIYGGLGENILDFIEEVNKKLNYGENYKFFIPEIKISSGKIPSKNTFYLDDHKDIITLGDLSNLETRGIVPSGIHGIEFAKKILGNK